MLPIRDANPTGRTPIVTIALIVVNVVIFVLWQPTFAGGRNADVEQQTFFLCHGEIPYEVTNQTTLAEGGPQAAAAIESDYGVTDGEGLQTFLAQECPDKSWVSALFESMFLHGGWLHIGGNMLFLWIFGNNIEDRLGHVVFLLFYLAGGLAASALQLLVSPDSTIPSVGASGAIAAILGAYLVLYPRARVTTLVIFFLITIVELPAVVVLGLWFVLQLLEGVGGLGMQVNSGGVAYFAHVGGFLFGLAVAFVFLRGRGGGTAFPTTAFPSRPDRS
jgi:membrane associated rhomboid family serine protease